MPTILQDAQLCIRSGLWVTIVGLKTATELNGRVGVVTSRGPDRVGVQIFPWESASGVQNADAPAIKLVKPQNLRVIEASRTLSRAFMLKQFAVCGYEDERGRVVLDPDPLMNKIFTAAQDGKAGVLKPLLDICAQDFCQDYEGGNVLHFAVMSGQANVVRLLMGHGPTRHLASKRDHDGDTPQDLCERVLDSETQRRIGPLLSSGHVPSGQAETRRAACPVQQVLVVQNFRGRGRGGVIWIRHLRGPGLPVCPRCIVPDVVEGVHGIDNNGQDPTWAKAKRCFAGGVGLPQKVLIPNYSHRPFAKGA